MSASSRPADGPGFLQQRPRDLHRPRIWHRLGYHMRTLQERLEALAGELPVRPGTAVLDYGCADVPYRHWFPEDVDYVPADLPGNPKATLHLAADGTVPAADGSFDVVLSTQVLEHVGDPARYLSECFRVLRPGGYLLLSTHGTMVYHPDPVDYWRWTCAGLQRVVGQAGFTIERFEGVMGLAATGLQLIQESFIFRIRSRLGKQIVATVIQALIALVDRFQGQESKDMNAFVYAIVARKPGVST